MALEQWIEWQGGEMPVEPRDYVEVDFGDGTNWDNYARSFDWSAKPNGIIRYRVVSEHEMFIREQIDRS